MPLAASGTMFNVYQSLDSYIRAVVVAGMGLPLHVDGARRFIPPPDAPWVRANYSLIGLNRAFKRQTGTPYLGVEVSGPLGLYLYRQMPVFTREYTTGLMAVRDTLLGYFPEAGLIPLHDFSQISGTPPSAPPQVAAFAIDGVREQWIDRGDMSGILCWEVSIGLRYLEEYSS